MVGVLVRQVLDGLRRFELDERSLPSPMTMVQYVYNAMAKARYEVLEDGSYYADTFLCPGVWAVGRTLEECRDALRDALIEWLVEMYEGEGGGMKLEDMGDLAWMNPLWRRPVA